MKRYLLFLLFALLYLQGKAQTYDGSISSLVTSAGQYLMAHQPEKLYLQLDKANYGLNDTLRFKAYLFNAISLRSSAQSIVVYIELSDENNKVQSRQIVALQNGLGWGSIALAQRDFPEGGYTLRAYTNWMRNFDESLVFKQQFYVSEVKQNSWLVNFNSAIQDKTAQLNLQLSGVNKQPIANQQVFSGVRQGGLVLRRDKPAITSPKGDLNIAVSVRDDEPAPVYAFVRKGSYDDKYPVYKFPVIYNRAEKTDVQFMPEGGYLVAGIPSVVGFKAVGENGKGVNISGSIINNATNAVITSFNSNVKGMGSFGFTPEANTPYKAVVTLPDGTKKDYPLPEIKTSGTVLSVVNPLVGDSVTIKITSSSSSVNRYFILGQSRGLTCYAAKVSAGNITQVLKAPKSAFASGIVRFSLLNEQLTTLNERVIYIDKKDNLKISVSPHKDYYTPQDSIALQVEVKDSNDKPVEGSFAMSVVNDLQLNSNTAPSSIAANLLLTSDLKGDVDDPNYYFTGELTHYKALDDLLLTQGWTGFDWKNILDPGKTPDFKAEADFAISGNVTNLLGKPAKGVNVYMKSFYPFYTIATKTDEKGYFILKDAPQQDSVAFIQARNNKDRKLTYGIQLDKPEWPVFAKNKLQMPWFLNTNTLTISAADTLLAQKERMDNIPQNLKGKVLQEVSIKATRIVQGSHNLNGTGNADQVMDEHDIAKEKPTTLLELLKNTIKGFNIKSRNGVVNYVINDSKLAVMMDGIDVRLFINNNAFSINNSPDYDYYKSLFEYYTSADIRGIEVMSSNTYLSQYKMNHVDPRCRSLCIIDKADAYLEITTREGTGPYLKKSLADIVYKPVPYVLDKQFYRPAYPVKNAGAAAFDQRSTIHWEPNIITGKDGKATVTFYAAGQPATYTITTEGSNMDGNVGSNVSKLTIKPPSP